MSKQPKDLRELLSMYKFDMDVLQKIPCTAEECKQYKKLLKEGQPLPDGVFHTTYSNGTDEFYTVAESDLTDSELMEYLTYKKLDLLRSIKNCLIFLSVMAGLSLAIFILLFLL